MNSPSSIPPIPQEILENINLIQSEKVRKSFLQVLENAQYRNNNHKNY